MENSDPVHNIIDSAASTMRNALRSAEWWKFVQTDVKDALDKILTNLEVLGPIFREAYIGLCKFEHARRVIENLTNEEEEGTLLFGSKMSEEAFQCGILATRTLLNLDDWISPNEADIQSCKYVCEVVGMLENIGVFSLGKEKLQPHARRLLGELLRDAKKNKTDSFDLTDIPFNFTDDSESP